MPFFLHAAVFYLTFAVWSSSALAQRPTLSLKAREHWLCACVTLESKPAFWPHERFSETKSSHCVCDFLLYESQLTAGYQQVFCSFRNAQTNPSPKSRPHNQRFELQHKGSLADQSHATDWQTQPFVHDAGALRCLLLNARTPTSQPHHLPTINSIGETPNHRLRPTHHLHLDHTPIRILRQSMH